jgi:hypothetical protein
MSLQRVKSEIILPFKNKKNFRLTHLRDKIKDKYEIYKLKRDINILEKEIKELEDATKKTNLKKELRRETI